MVQRRLAAILAADVAGYTRLMEQDTDGTVAAWTTARDDLIKPTIKNQSGQIIKFTGDGFLVEFSSVQNAVICAIQLQESLKSSPLEFRMGINLGDIVDDGIDIHGEGVNIAARLESIAEPGGICISGEAHSLVRNRLDATFRDMGEQQVKHVSNPVRVYAIDMTPDGGQDPAAVKPPQKETRASTDEVAHFEKPSIAVLPFDNMSADAEQEFFVDGLTEDILTELSRFNELFVISRNSTFTYKGKATNVRDVARDLDVRYVVEGSVRKAGNRIRVSVQLIDGANDRHVWAERYDRDLDDIFDLQDEITAAIVAVLPGRIEADSHDRALRRPTDSMQAYECLLAGKVLHHRSNKEDNAEALRFLDRAIELDPNYVHARAWRACVIGQAWGYGWPEDSDAALEEAKKEIARAVAIDDNDADIHRILAALNIAYGNFDQAQVHQDRGLALNPNYDLVVVQQGELLTWLGRGDEGVEWIKKAMQLNPFHPPRFWNHLGRAYFVARKYDDAIAAFKKIDPLDENHLAFIAACFAHLGKEPEAAEYAQKVLSRSPDFTADAYLTTTHYKNEEDRAHHREGLLKAGLP